MSESRIESINVPAPRQPSDANREIPVRNQAAPSSRETAAANSFSATSTRLAAENRNARVLWRLQLIEELRALILAVNSGVTDQTQLVDLIFSARHPELGVRPVRNEGLAEWNAISALLVEPLLRAKKQLATSTSSEAGEIGVDLVSRWDSSSRTRAGADKRFDRIIALATQYCPGLPGPILEGLLAQESNFQVGVVNKFGYAGIAQLGAAAARQVGLSVTKTAPGGDERLDPLKAIPAAAKVLNSKAECLNRVAFARYGRPVGAEYWKFVLAAYNGGEGTVTLAMGHAYRQGMAIARARQLTGVAAVDFSRAYAARWNNLKGDGLNSPLGLAVGRYFPQLLAAKYKEIGNFPDNVFQRIR